MWDYLLPFCLLHNHHSIPPIVLCPWLTLMYCVKVEKVREHQKYETIAWIVIGVVHDLIFGMMKIEHSQTIWFCRDNFLWPCYFEKTWLLWLVCLKYYYFYVNIKLLSWIFWMWIFIPQLRRITLKLCQVALRIKNSVFIIYLLEDEQELSLGMLDTSPTYL